MAYFKSFTSITDTTYVVPWYDRLMLTAKLPNIYKYKGKLNVIK